MTRPRRPAFSATLGTMRIALLALATSVLAGQPAEPPSSLPQVTVQAQREAVRKQADTFVRKVTGSAWAADEGEHVLGLWRAPVCPLVAGLNRPQGEFLFKRLTEVITLAGAHPGQLGCRPNLIVLVTTQPEQLLRAWYKRDRRLFAGAMPALVRRFFDEPRPVRFWYITTLAGESGESASPGSTALAQGAAGSSASQLNLLLGDIPTFSAGTGGRVGSRLGLGAVHDLATAVIVVDLRQAEGFTWGQLADYIAMAALTNVDSYSDFTGVPSVLALFSATPETRPAALTDWDRSYLKALYRTDRMSPLQRVSIAAQMARDLSPTK